MILRVLDVIEKAEAAVVAGAEYPTSLYERVLDFASTFADKCHHCKEEGQMFPVVEERGVPNEGGPIGCMLREHTRARELTASSKAELGAAAKGDRWGQGKIRRNLMGYVELLRDHISKEDNILFEMADRVMTEEDQVQMEKDFEEAMKRNVGEGVSEQYRRMVDELEAEVASLAESVRNKKS